ncbi:hypothetical protein [Enterococcus sp. N249-2]
MENKKYDKDEQYIAMTFMQEVWDVDELKKISSASEKSIYGYVIGHWTTEEEQEAADYPLMEIQYRRVIKADDLDDEYLNDINFEKEFIGILYDAYYKDLEKQVDKAEYTLFIDEKEKRIGQWWVGTEL